TRRRPPSWTAPARRSGRIENRRGAELTVLQDATFGPFLETVRSRQSSHNSLILLVINILRRSKDISCAISMIDLSKDISQYPKEKLEMFGMRHFGSRCEDRHGAGRHGGWRHHRHGFGGGRHGRGGDAGGGDMMRAGRMLAQGDLRLLALALIAEQPRHGYEIIKVLEEKTEGWYAPSPGIVYPTLTYLEEAGYVTAQADGTKKLYTITSEGRVYLEQNRAFVDAVLERLAAVGERAGR